MLYGFRIRKNFVKRFLNNVLLLESNINLHERNNIVQINTNKFPPFAKDGATNKL